MAFAKDASVANDFNAASGSFSYTVNSNSERFLLVEIHTDDATVSTVTYNTVGLTFIGSITNGSFGIIEFWGLLMPATGSNTLAWTLSASDKHNVAVTGMSGVNQTTAYRNFTGATGNSTTPSVTVAGTTVEHKVFDGVTVQEGATDVVLTEGAGQTELYEDRTTGGSPLSNVIGSGSIEDGGAVSTTMSWTLSLTRQWAIAAVEILPVIEGEMDLQGIALISPNGSYIASGKVSYAGVGTMVTGGGRVRLGVASFTGIAAMTCFPVFPTANVNIPVAVPQQFFFMSDENEFLLRWVLQETNRPKRVELGRFLQVTLKVNGMADKACVIEDANDGVVYYITTPAEFPVGRYTAHLTMVLDGNFDSSVPEDEETDAATVYEIEVDTPDFIIWVQAPA